MSEAIPCLFTDLFKAVEAGLKKKLKQTIKSLQPLLESLDANATAVLENEKNPLKDTNLIILCCKFGQLNILDYFLNSGKQFIDSLYNGTIADVLSPVDEDVEGHNAFYYAIRSNNVEIVQLLLTKWLPSFDESVARKDFLLSEAYEELKLRNVTLTEEMEFFIVCEIVSSRFFSSYDYGPVPVFKNDLLQRMDWLLNNIEAFKTADGESTFLVLAKCIAQSINILKYQLKATYDKIPWEELEFCLVSYIVPRLRHKEKSIIPFVAVTKETLLSQLTYFAAKLKSLSANDLLGPNEFPNMSKEDVAEKIKKESEEFISLYEIYGKVRDLYSLEKIEEYLKMALPANINEKQGQLAIVRVLQVLGDYLENTLDNCKLSVAMSRIILSALPTSTRSIVFTTINVLKERLEIEENSAKFFCDVQNDLKLLSYVVCQILNREKLRIVVDLIEKVTKSDNGEEVCELGKRIKLVQNSIDGEHFEMFEEEKIVTLINKLWAKISISRTFCREQLLFEGIKGLHLAGFRDSDLASSTLVVLGPSALHCLDQFKFDRKLNARGLAYIKNAATVALRVLSPSSYIEKMSKVLVFVQEIHQSVKYKTCSNISKSDDEKMNMLFFRISFAVATKFEDILCLDVTQDVLDLVDSSRLNLSETELEKHFESKVLDLKNLIGSELMSADVLKENKSLRLATELLLLDIFSISDGATSDSKKKVSYEEEYASVLTGKCLKNYLSRGSALFDIFTTDPTTATWSNALLLIKNKLSIEDCNIENGFCNASEAKKKCSEKMRIVAYQDKLFGALERGDTKKSFEFIKFGADVFGRSINDESSLHFAAKSLNIDLAKFIVEQKVKADLVDKVGRTTLHVAVAHGNADLVEYLIKNGANADLNQRDDDGLSPLHLAAKQGDVETVQVLATLGADILSLTEGKSWPLLFLDIDFFLAGSYTFGCGTVGQLTPIHVAAEYNRVDVIRLLLEKGVSVDAHNEVHISPLMVAAYNGSVETAEFLIEAGADVHAYSDGGFTALHFAADKGHTAVASILLQNGVNFDTINLDRPIHFAALNGQVEVIKLLIEHGAYSYGRNKWGCTPLHLAAMLGHTQVVHALLEAGVYIHAEDVTSRTALHLAASNGCLEVTKFLVEQGALTYFTALSEGTPLHLAIEGGHDEVGKILVNSGANINFSRDSDGFTPLLLAMKKKSNEFVRLLLEKGADPDAKIEIGLAPLHYGSLICNAEAVALLIRHKCNVNILGPEGRTALHYASTVGCCEGAELLLKNGAKVNSTCQSGLTPLYVAVDNEHLNMVKLLVKYGADLNLGVASPVEKSIANNSKDFLEYLVTEGADISKHDLLLKSVSSGSSDCMRILLENGCPAHSTGYSALHLAAEKGPRKIVSDLILHGANVNSRSLEYEKGTPLHYAVKFNNREAVEVLLSSGARIDTKARKGPTALHYAAEFADCQIIELLLANGADPLMEDNEGETPLSLSIRREDPEKVEAMFKSEKFDKNVRFRNGMTPLHLAAEISLDIVKFLVNNGFVLNTDNDGMKPIHIASITGKQNIVEYFLESGVSIDERSSEQRTPLHYAALWGHHSLVEYLISKGANVNAKDNDNSTPLALAGRSWIVKLLLKNGAFFDENVDLSGDGKVYLDVMRLLKAVKHNDVNEVKNQIKIGTCLNAVSSSSGSPLHFASCKGYLDIVKLLLENDANVNVLDTKGSTPLHCAVENSHCNIVLELLFHGAIYNALTEEGSTPLRVATDRNIKELLTVIEKCFDLVEKGDKTVESTIQNLGSQNERHLKALIKTKNRNNQDIFQVADVYKYRRPNELFEICHADYIKIDSQGLGGRDLDEETLAKIKSEFKENQEWLASKNDPSASSVCRDINNVLLSLEEYENTMKQAKQKKNYRTPPEKQNDVIAAVLKGDLDLLKELLQGGGGVNETESNGRTALHYAVDRVDEKSVQLLLQYGADITQASHKGNTALHTAVNKQSAPIVTMLLEFAVNNRKLDFINKPTLAKGNTALHVAAKNGNLDVLKTLLKFGATYEIENRDGQKPKDLSSNVEVVRFFDLLSQMFADAKAGNFRLIKQMKSLKEEDVSAVAGARNLGGRTILQVAISHKRKNISSNLLKIIQAANAK